MNKYRPIFMCSHLVTSPDDYHVWFTGRGLDHYLVCSSCAERFPELPVELIDATETLFERCQSEAWWSGIRGQPEIRHRSSSLSFAHEDCSLTTLDGDRWIDIQPRVKSDGQWYVLLESGKLVVTNPRQGEFEVLHHFSDFSFEIDDETALCVSPKNDYAAIFETSKRHASVFDLRTGAITAQIDRGEYHSENSIFPITFFESNGRSLLVAATDWNRLDLVDPATGIVLTDRGPTSYQRGEQRPPHYLDYFHAQLLASPDGSWIVDNGWVWHPWGTVRSWNLSDWVEQNPWESEDGPSLKSLAGRAYFWDGPLCWIDGSTIAIWGWGNDADWVIPAVQLFDVRLGRELYWFPGPETRTPRAWPPKKLEPSVFFDQYLFAIHDGRGIAVWDVSSGERLLQDPSLVPIQYHPGSSEFLSRTPNGIRLSRLNRPSE
jgi:hypothetical protein